MTNAFAEQQQLARDLRTQLAGLDKDDEQQMQFIEWSPGRKTVKLWSMSDGTEISIPRYMVLGAITKYLKDGRYAFTAHPHACECGKCTPDVQAPIFRKGNVRCFLADDSPERTAGLLERAGLDHLEPCPAKELRSTYSKRIHAQNRHKQSWETLQDHIGTQRDQEYRDEQHKQTEAMMALAGAAAEERRGPGRPRKEQ